MTCLNTALLIKDIHIGTAPELSLVGPRWPLESPAPLPVVSCLTFGMSAPLPALTFPSELRMPLKQAVCGRLCVGGGGEALGMKWDTFMEYCMLNNRLREGVMSLSRKHKHYVLIRRLIINKVQGRCSESKLFRWYLLGQRAPLIGQLKSTLLQSLIGITTFTDFLGTVLPFSLPLH